jgi:predicted nucleotidyltransferase
MNGLIEQRRQQLERICRQHRVRRMELFGSAAGPGFDPSHSDLDFLVTFQELGPDQYADAYFGLLEALQALFQRPVDLVVDSAIQNPFFRQAVESTRTLVYADFSDRREAEVLLNQ